MKEPLLENKQLAGAVAVGSGAISSTHLFGYQWESWILWMSFALTFLLLWGQLKLHIIKPVAAWVEARRLANERKRKAAIAKKRRESDR